MSDEDLIRAFRNEHYLRINEARVRLLEAYEFDWAGKIVFEPGAGIGDLTEWLLTQGAAVIPSDARGENVDFIKRRFSNLTAWRLDMCNLPPMWVAEFCGWKFDVTFCFGLLYHLPTPIQFMKTLRTISSRLLLETRVHKGDPAGFEVVEEPREDPSQSVDGVGCLLGRDYLLGELKSLFDVVRVLPPAWAPHEEFKNGSRIVVMAE